ncbi:nickel-dependent hydrogenase large subunit [Streptomyces microflavus]|uniref:nickel-dependent hydrogenase large subunit n=1 Tax=Streptomyces microflavus TaxID=1919 RepID=UPI003817D91B
MATATGKPAVDADGPMEMSWDPITRIVGSLGIHTKIDFAAKRVAECYSTSSIFRGYSVFMKGKDPRDAHFITSRICGICGDNHATCSVYAQNMAYGVAPPHLGEWIINLGEAAEAMLADVFEVTDRAWRGIGMIPQSGWRLSPKYREYDAEHRFSVTGIETEESTVCRSGEVLQGLIKPHECAAFGKECTPRNPLGATMVSSEGACAAYYLYRRLDVPEKTPKAATKEASSVG